jgi:hypothetical protein
MVSRVKQSTDKRREESVIVSVLKIIHCVWNVL